MNVRVFTFSLLFFCGANAEEFNYSEENVPPYQLPNPLQTTTGLPVTTADQWNKIRRPELLSLIEQEMFGKSPARPKLHYAITEKFTPALNGKAIRQQVTLYFSHDKNGPFVDVLLYLPVDTTHAAPVIFGLNFMGNQSVASDPSIKLCRSWMDNKTKDPNPELHHAKESSRGVDADKWQIDYAISRGYGVVTAYYGDIDPDFDDQWKNGVHALYPDIEKNRDAHTWGSLAAWAWGMSYVMDYLTQEEKVDSTRVALQGFSRLGKAALWAGASDKRFALVISQNSGAGGAALNRRIFGETVGRLNASFPHWFCKQFRDYSLNEKAMPFDSHELLALIAPRPLLITSATEDRWSDPRGEFLAGKAASPVYQLLGTKGLESDQQPDPATLIKSRIGYFLRSGPHSVTHEDWQAYCDFCDHWMK
jgi:hypothetical protein